MKVDRPVPPTAARLFGVVWEITAEVIGSAATATVLRRGARRAAAAGANVGDLTFERTAFEYTYVLPDAWSTPSPDAMKALRALVRELLVLLRELTGVVLVRRLQANVELRDAELFDNIEAP